MSDTTIQECKKCGIETDCINGICQECVIKDQQIPIKKFTEECRKHICVSQIEGFVPYNVAKRLVYLLCDRLDYLDKDLAHETDMAAQAHVGCMQLETENKRLKEYIHGAIEMSKDESVWKYLKQAL